MRTRNLIALSAAAVVLLAATSILVIAAARGGFDMGNGGERTSSRTTCAVPNLPGSVVNVSLTNMGGPMMGRSMMGGGVRGGTMRLTTDVTSVPHGTVSFIATNLGSINHELVILPLPDSQIVGTRPLRDDSTIDETASIGEASNTCGSDSGDGIAPGGSSWTTVTLAAGRYELVCNLPGHYAAGMYTQLTVR
jgi:uncharacterized cupredoxin-like copper-binding protein